MATPSMDGVTPDEVDRLTAQDPDRVVIPLRWQLAGRGPSGGDELPRWNERTNRAIDLMKDRGYIFEKSVAILWFWGRDLYFKRSDASGD